MVVGRVTGITYHRGFGDVMDIVKILDVGKRLILDAKSQNPGF